MRQSPFKQRVPVEKLVEVAWVVVPDDAVNDWRVVEPRNKALRVVVEPPRMVRPVA